ncbi:MAG: DUF4402 domain-containing protein [Pseudomonadota bacterium]
MRLFFILAVCGLVVGLFTSAAFAVTQSVTANIAFDTALTLTKNADINFGRVKAATADTYTINTAGTVTAAGSGQYLGGTTAAGNITIAGSTTQTINVSVGNYTANGGVTPQSATCAYNGGGAAACSLTGVAAPGAGKTLLLGVQAVVDGSQAAGTTAAPTFDVTVVYN